MKTKEVVLREEIRAITDALMRVIEWGTGTLAAANVSLFFVRNDLVKRLVAISGIPKDSPLPLARYFVGTFFLGILAFIFTRTYLVAARRYISYRQQLYDMRNEDDYSGIVEIPPRNLQVSTAILFWAFPAFDIFMRIFISVTVNFT